MAVRMRYGCEGNLVACTDIFEDSEDMPDEQFKYYWVDKLQTNLEALGLAA